MSTNQNTIWLEASKENLEEAISLRNWALADDIIQDTKEAGFSIESDALQLELNKAMLDPV